MKRVRCQRQAWRGEGGLFAALLATYRSSVNCVPESNRLRLAIFPLGCVRPLPRLVIAAFGAAVAEHNGSAKIRGRFNRDAQLDEPLAGNSDEPDFS